MPVRQWDPASRVRVVLEGLQGKPETALCKRHGIKPTEYRRWRTQFFAKIAHSLEFPDSSPKGEGSVLSSLSAAGGENAESLRVAREVIEALPIPVFFKARDGKHLGANRAWETYFGVTRESFIGKTVEELFSQTPEIAAKHHAEDEALWISPGTRSYELQVPVHDGSIRYTLNYKATFTGADGEIAGLIGTIIDITERKRAEQRQEIEHRVTRILSESETIAGAMPGVLAAFCESLGWACGARWSKEPRTGGFRCEETWSIDNPGIKAFLAASRENTYQPGHAGFVRKVLGTGQPVWIADVAAERTFTRGKLAAEAGLRSAFALPIRLGDQVLGAMEFFHRERRLPDDWLLGTGATIGNQVGYFIARTQSEEELRQSEARFRSLTALSSDWYWEQDEEFRLTFLSSRFVERTGIDPAPYIGRKRWEQPASNLSEADWQRHRSQLERHEPFFDFEMERTGPDGNSVWLSLSGEPVFDEGKRFRGYRGVGTDITERKRGQAILRAAYEELARSNAELEQFAYVASHDLQEPLRMIGSYTQLLERRYGDKLDQDAHEFMDFIVDGATRMKQLIEDLLAYSRVGTRGKNLQRVQGQAVLERALINLRGAIEQSGAAITHDSLPEVNADDTQLVQLLQNLIANAIKFRKKDEAPRIRVAAEDTGKEWRFSVVDNGIGIEQAYFERIFMVFQRLHTQDEYPGTGIGLAICRKVVERHGGRIWVESTLGEGSKFHFTLPKIQKGET
ncbi:MAG TPA: PAS domain S-box protein [Burkholderiales bacterium]